VIALIAAIIMALRAFHVLDDSNDVEWALVSVSLFFLHFAYEIGLPRRTFIRGEQ
jgi:hypothetical protein